MFVVVFTDDCCWFADVCIIDKDSYKVLQHLGDCNEQVLVYNNEMQLSWVELNRKLLPVDVNSSVVEQIVLTQSIYYMLNKNKEVVYFCHTNMHMKELPMFLYSRNRFHCDFSFTSTPFDKPHLIGFPEDPYGCVDQIWRVEAFTAQAKQIHFHKRLLELPKKRPPSNTNSVATLYRAYKDLPPTQKIKK